MGFKGAKVALFLGGRLLVYRRDHTAGIPYPGALDLPGGGRENGEGPFGCVQRETFEEFALRLPRHAIVHARPHRYAVQGHIAWFFVAHMPKPQVCSIRFGSEGETWALMQPREFLSRTDAVPHLQKLLRLHSN